VTRGRDRAPPWGGADTASFWQAEAADVVVHPPLRGVVEAEFAIVGAGIAGLSLALQLALAGREVVVVEESVPGAGALGASAGIVAPQLVRTTPVRVLTRLGREVGGGWLRLIGESGGHLFDLIREHAIACDARPQGFVAPARGEDAARRLAMVVEQWRPFRRDLTVLDAAAVAALTGTAGYTAAVLDASGGGVDPVRLAQGLAERLVAAGGRLFHHSPATALNREPQGWCLLTSGGTVRAAGVVLCANGGNHRLHPMLHETVLPMRIHELVTRPLSSAMRAAVLPHGQALTDLERDIFSIRWIAGDRLLTYYPVSAHATADAVEIAVNDRLRAMLRYHEPVRIAHVWQGVAWMNSSLLPRVVRLDDRLLAVQACNGRGIATNAIVGREVARMLLAPQTYRPQVALDVPRAIRGFALARHLPNVLLHGARAVARWTRR
jgi:glycine/D-amino acid oxidase-like deaminating enzyme